MNIDYSNCRFGVKQWIMFFIKGFLFIFAISNLFYDSFLAIIPLLLLFIPYYKLEKDEFVIDRKRRLIFQFKEAIESIGNGLEVGYSMENATDNAYKELSIFQSKKEYQMILVELNYMALQLKNNRAIEALWEDFGERSKCSDIMMFAQILSICKRSGGNINEVIRQAITTIGEKIEVENDIRTSIRGKEFEQKIMNVIPIAILFYIKTTSPGYFDVLYKNIGGIMIMTLCLVLYGVSFIMARFITNIRI